MDANKIKTIEDLEMFLGEQKVAELFLQHYIKTVGVELEIPEELKNQDLFNIGD